MKGIVLTLALVLLMAGSAFGAPTAVTATEVSSVEVIDSTGGAFLTTLIPADGVIFANDDLTFILLYDSLTTETLTVDAPATTIYVQGYGLVTLSDITIALVAANANFAICKIPTRYNVAGKVTLVPTTGNKVKIGVFKLSKY